MYIGFYNYYQAHNGNKMLTQTEAGIGDNLNYPFVLLAQKLKTMGHTVATIDTDSIDNFNAVVFVEFPGEHNPYFKKCLALQKNMYLILLESPVIKPDNYDMKNHAYFKKVFTWADNLVDNPSINSGQAKKYFKIQYSHHIPAQFYFGLGKKEKLCTLISSNKSVTYKNQLYSERVNAIRWFEKHHPEDFDLYGKGWDRHNFEGTFLGIKIARLNRLRFLTKLLALHYPSYKGGVASKNEAYQKYRFSICYENVKDIQGYITEKIMDCFLAGCVPIYLGAQNITDHIPADTFIDKRHFSTYEQLYDYIKKMPDKEYLGYLEAISAFLKSPRAIPFSAEYFANIIIKEII